MWLVSDECTRVGRETKRLWNSCQARVLQNGLLTAFSIPLHHSSWTLPLISSPALPIPFLCLLPPPPQLSLLQKRMHKASVEYFKQRSLYSRAGLDRCQALSHESDRRIRRAQVSVHIRVKTGEGGWGLSPPPNSTFTVEQCRFPSKRRRIPFIPQRLHVTLAIVWASPCVFFARQGRPGGH